MKTTIDRSGRLVFPDTLREEFGLNPGTEVEIRVRNGHLEMEPVSIEVRVEQEDDLPVAAPSQPVPPLTREVVQETIEAVRAERGGLFSSEE